MLLGSAELRTIHVRNAHWREYPLAGMPTGRNAHRLLVWRWVFSAEVIPGFVGREPPLGVIGHTQADASQRRCQD